MSTVTLSIGPKSYTVACADGQEAHIKALGAMIAEKYAQLGSAPYGRLAGILLGFPVGIYSVYRQLRAER